MKRYKTGISYEMIHQAKIAAWAYRVYRKPQDPDYPFYFRDLFRKCSAPLIIQGGRNQAITAKEKLAPPEEPTSLKDKSPSKRR